MNCPDEDILLHTAPLALALAPDLCRSSCRSYHAVWGFLRLFGLSAAALSDEDYIRPRAAAAFSEGARRVLISGAADGALLWLVAKAASDAGVLGQIRVSVLDLCETPLRINEHAASRLGLTIETLCMNVLELDTQPFDMILAHNVIAFVPDEMRDMLAGVWFRHLAPGGTLLVLTGLHGEGSAQTRRFTEDRIPGMLAVAETARANHPARDLISAGQLAELVNDFASTRTQHRVSVAADLTERLQGAGFEIAEQRVGESTGARGPFQNSGTKLKLMALRPAVR